MKFHAEWFPSGDEFFTYLRTRSTCCTPRARPARRRCCRSGCTAASSAAGARAALARFLDHVRAHDECGSRAGSTSRGTGRRPTRSAPHRGRPGTGFRNGNRRMTRPNERAACGRVRRRAPRRVRAFAMGRGARAGGAPFRKRGRAARGDGLRRSQRRRGTAARAAARASGTRRPRDDPQRTDRRLVAGAGGHQIGTAPDEYARLQDSTPATTRSSDSRSSSPSRAWTARASCSASPRASPTNPPPSSARHWRRWRGSPASASTRCSA